MTYQEHSVQICWPGPATNCLKGTCAQCWRAKFTALSLVERYAERRGLLPELREGLRGTLVTATNIPEARGLASEGPAGPRYECGNW